MWENADFVAEHLAVVVATAAAAAAAYVQVWENGDFVAGYSVWTRDQVTATVHVEAPQPGMPDQRGTFALSITPPGAGCGRDCN
jgi:hypothetical protein